MRSVALRCDCAVQRVCLRAAIATQGHQVQIFEARPFVGGKVASYQDKDGNHIEMGLHVFFGCYFNLFRLMAKASASDAAHKTPFLRGPVLSTDDRSSLSPV